MVNSNQVVAINSEKIDKTILAYTNYIERLKSVFIRADDLMDGTASFYECDNATEMRRKYSIFRDNYPVLIENLNSYIEELKAIKLNYAQFSEDLSETTKKSARTVDETYNRYQE